jgi:transcriptional regulator with XRE-family HTH domain
LNGHSATPRPSTLEAIARAFKIPVEKLYRIAGLLPEVPETEEFSEEVLHNLNQIQDPKRKSTALSLIKALVAEEEDEKNQK